MSAVTRKLSGAQFSRIVTHGGGVHPAREPAKDLSAPVRAQMDETPLERVDAKNPPARACVETRPGNSGSGVMTRVVAAL